MPRRLRLPGRRYVLDANALVGYFEDRAIVADRVEQLLQGALSLDLPLLISAVNWGEVFYIEWKYQGESGAREAAARLNELPIAVIPADLDRATRAIRRCVRRRTSDRARSFAGHRRSGVFQAWEIDICLRPAAPRAVMSNLRLAFGPTPQPLPAHPAAGNTAFP